MKSNRKKIKVIKPWKGGRTVRICGVCFTPVEAADVRMALELPKMSVADLAVLGARAVVIAAKGAKKNE